MYKYAQNIKVKLNKGSVKPVFIHTKLIFENITKNTKIQVFVYSNFLKHFMAKCIPKAVQAMLKIVPKNKLIVQKVNLVKCTQVCHINQEITQEITKVLSSFL
jgi:hypothetical protein